MRKIFLMMPIVATCSTLALAEQTAHVHGVASMNLAVDGDEMEIEFVSPADGIVGFEYAPSNDDDRKAVKDAITLLRNPETLFELPASAGCNLHEVEVERQVEGDPDDQGHEESENSGGHSEFQAHYRFDCQGSAIKTIELTLFNNWPRIEKLQVQALTPNGQTGGNINANNPVIRLP